MKKIAILTGTSGLVGMQLLHQMIQDNSYDQIISVGRRNLALKHRKLVQVVGDFEKIRKWDLEDKLRESDLGGDHFSLIAGLKEKRLEIHAYCALGTTIKVAGSKESFYKVDHDLVIEYAFWVHKLGATKFLYVSALGANPKASVFYNQVKGEVERDLEPIPFNYLGIFRPSLLLGNRRDFRLGEEIAKFLTKPLVWLKLFDKYRPIYDHQVAKAMMFHANKSVTIKEEVIFSSDMQIF